MKAGYLIKMTDGSEALLFDRARAHGLAGHHGWTVKNLTIEQTRAHILKIAKAAKVKLG